MRVTFVQPSMGRDGHKYVRSWQMQPLSIAALAGATPAEHEVAFFDDRVEPIDFDRPTDVAAITVETYTARRAYQIAREYRRRGVPVVMGGYHATLVPDEVAQEADAVVLADGEAAWPGLLADVRRGALKKRYDGRSSPGPLVVAPRREIFSGKPYLPLGLVESGRGCRFSCDFCAVTAFSRATYRARPVKDVAREVEAAGHRQVFIVDDNLTADLGQAKALLRELIPLRIRWTGQASIHVADDPEMLDLLEKSGCAVLLVGFESIDRDCLRAMNKTFNRGAAEYEIAIRRLRDKGVKLYATFVFGYDTDPPDVFERTFDFAMRQRFFLAAFNALQPFPGTPLYRRLEKEGRLVYDRWWLEPGYRFGTVAYRPRAMEPEALYAALMDLRRRFFSYRNIAWRGLDLKANARGLGSAGLHLLVNHLLRRELDEKWRTPLGDVTEDSPASTAPSVRSTATGPPEPGDVPRAGGSGAAQGGGLTSRAPASADPVLGLARAEDDAEIRRLLRDNPMRGDIRVSLECEPSFLLAAAVTGERHDTIVGREHPGGRVLGMGTRSVFPAWVNGAPCRLGYLSQLRVEPSHRRHRRLLAAGYTLAQGLRRSGEATFDITTVIADNKAARHLLERNLPGMPRYVELEKFVTLILPCTPRRREACPAGFGIERARDSDLTEVAACLDRNRRRYQFAPRFTAEDLRSTGRSRGLRPQDFQLAVAGDRLIGCLALWDQTSFKQAVVHGYSRRLRLLRPWLNLVAPLVGLPRLPAPGRALPLGTVSHVAVDDDRTEAFLALMTCALADGAARGHACVAVGLAGRHPWLPEVERRFGGRRYESVLYAVHDDAGAEAVRGLDGRLPHLELALL